jgi:hypothetical protein
LVAEEVAAAAHLRLRGVVGQDYLELVQITRRGQIMALFLGLTAYQFKAGVGAEAQ